MILSDIDIKRLIQDQKLFIDPLNEVDIRECSIKLHLSADVASYTSTLVDLKNDATAITKDFRLPEKGYVMRSNEFLLGCTEERITIPNGYFGLIETSGSIARAGLQTHLCDAHIDPGTTNSKITLQLKNTAQHKIRIYPNLYIIKLYIFEVSSESKVPYNGIYQTQDAPTAFKRKNA